jgi:YD repeat-containing protein
MDRLFYVDYPLAGQPAVTYTFDAADRRTQITRNATTVTYAHDDANRRASLTPLGTLTYGYDPGATGSRSAGRGHAAGLRRVVVTKARRLTPIKPAPA